MKKPLSALLALAMPMSLGVPAAAAGSGKAPVFENGAAQPILQYTNLRDANYTNEGSDILRFCVYVETDHDTDGDGRADLAEALVQVPRAAAEGDFKAATICDPTPCGAGIVKDAAPGSSKLMNPVPFDYDKLYAPSPGRASPSSPCCT